MYGERPEVLPQYRKFLKEFKSWSKEEKQAYKESVRRKQSGEYLLRKIK
jgi:hypothetical protein